MSAPYYASVAVHVLAAMLWLGGMISLAVVGAPVLRRVEPPALRQQLFQELGYRYRRAGWWAIGVLVLAGVANLHFRGWLRWEGALGDADFWQAGVGQALAVKLAAVGTMIVVGVVHDFVLGPAAGRAPAGSGPALTLRRQAALLARLNAAVGVVVVLAAARLARGG